jgi:hypothetical protein
VPVLHCGHQPLAPAAAPAEPTAVLPPVPERTAELDVIPPDDPPVVDDEPEAWGDEPEAWGDEPGVAEHHAPAAHEPVWVQTPPAAPSPPPVWAAGGPANTRRPTARRSAAVLAGAAALVLVAVVAVAGLLNGTGSDTARSAASSGSAAASSTVPVDPGTVHVRASSTQHPDDGVSYAATNTLDGDHATAWNSDGQGAGATLTYTFPEPVDLRSITLLNGYQKALTRSNGSPVDLYLLNERVKTLKVVTDTASVTWPLRDERGPQTLSHAFGSTTSVRLQVVSVYPSQKYKDLAVSDVSFAAANG